MQEVKQQLQQQQEQQRQVRLTPTCYAAI